MCMCVYVCMCMYIHICIYIYIYIYIYRVIVFIDTRRNSTHYESRDWLGQRSKPLELGWPSYQCNTSGFWHISFRMLKIYLESWTITSNVWNSSQMKGWQSGSLIGWPSFLGNLRTGKCAIHICIYACMYVYVYIYIYIYIYMRVGRGSRNLEL